jgi:hypothetical protein
VDFFHARFAKGMRLKVPPVVDESRVPWISFPGEDQLIAPDHVCSRSLTLGKLLIYTTPRWHAVPAKAIDTLEAGVTKDKNGKGKTASASTGGAMQQPLFYKNPKPLNSAAHGRLGVREGANYAFAQQANAVMLTALEFALASRTYPIVFTSQDTPSPVALLGLRQDHNLFVKDGQWEARAYIPAYVRRYPFAFVESEDKSRLILCIDEDADAISPEGETKLFTDGKPSEFTNMALEFCNSFQAQHNVTRQLCQALADHDLLVDRQADITLPDGQHTAVREFHVVDEERLAKVSDEVFLDFRKLGILPFIYFHLMSLANFRDLAERTKAP